MINYDSRLKGWIGGAVLLMLLLSLLPQLIGWKLQKVTTSLSKEMSSSIVSIALNPELKLTEPQKIRIRILEKQYESEMRVFCERHCSARMKIGKMLQSGEVDNAQLAQLARDVGEAYRESEEATMRHVMEICAILAPEQKAIYLKKVSASIAATCPREFVR